MYFKEKNDTNIDLQFSKKGNNILSQMKSFIFKYKLVLIIIIVVLLLLMGSIFLFNNKEERYFVLKGEDIITIYKNSEYIDPGYNAYSSKDKDLNDEVVVDSNLNTKEVGEYQITYKFGNLTKIRTVKVIEQPKDYTYIYLNNGLEIYLNLGEEYVEPGYMVFSSDDEELNDKVVVSGSVDSKKIGIYKLTYSVVDSKGVTVSKSRLVYILGTEINLSLDNNDWTKNDVTIKVNVVDNFFDYLILPDGNKVNVDMYSYKVSSNGKYTFKTRNKRGVEKEETIEVKNIDREAPSGSCSGSFMNGVSSIKVSAFDNAGLKKYEVDGTFYTDSNIKINKELSKVNIKIYDNAGNVKDISCTLKDNNKPVLFGKNIKLDYHFYTDSLFKGYALFSPNIDNNNKKIPLIVWLHGSGETNVSEIGFKNSGLLYVLLNWKLEGFNAYVLCPISSGSWNNTDHKNKLDSLIEQTVKKYNIDTKKIILVGHSMGSVGVQYMAYYRQNYFSAMVVLSGYDTGLDLTQISKMPVKGYTEPGLPYMTGKFSSIFGKDNVTVLSTSHGNVPNASFNEDKNGDGRSDLIEWMLNQELK